MVTSFSGRLFCVDGVSLEREGGTLLRRPGDGGDCGDGDEQPLVTRSLR